MDLSQPRSPLMLPVLLSGTFLYAFDANVVNVALPSLRRQLQAGPAALELLVGGYAFSYAAGLVTGGRLGDRFGYRRVFLAGLAAFSVASLLCGLAQQPAELVAARLAQGLAAAAMVPQVLALITASFPAQARTRALTWFGVVAALSGVAGQVLGGLLLDVSLLGLGWRPLFFVSVPVGAAAFGLAWRLVPRDAARRRPALDLPGVLAVAAALALALLPLIFGREAGWPAWAWAMLAASVPAAVLAARYEQRVASRGGAPLLDLSLFRSPGFSAGMGIAVAFMAFFTSTLFVTSLLLQSGLGLSPLRAGLSYGPFCLAAVITAVLGGSLITRYGRRAVIWAGCACSAAGTALLAALLTVAGGAVSVGWLVAGLGLVGAGNSMILTAYLGAALAAIRPEQAGAASGTLNTVQQFAGVVGLATIGALFYAFLGPHPDPDRYARAAAVVQWAGLALVAVMAALTRLLPSPGPRTTAPAPQAAASAPRPAAPAPPGRPAHRRLERPADEHR
jgi:MFS family permease